MRRPLAFLLAFLLSGLPVLAAARTASSSGVWNTALTTPGAVDTCTINTGVVVDCNQATCTCGSMNNNGSLYCSNAAGCTWVFGNATANCEGAATDTVCASTAAYVGTGEWVIGNLDVFTVDVGTDALENLTENEIAPSAGGVVRIQGKRIIGGEVLRVDETAKENCPQGSYPELANGDPSIAIASCNVDFKVYVDIGRPVRQDEFDGLVLGYLWPAGRRGTWYDILDTIPPNILQLDGDSRGQMRRHGYQETATATVAAASVDVTATSGFSAFDTVAGKYPIGGHFMCTATDCTPQDHPPGGVSAENYYMPCLEARRIIAAPTTTTLTLKNAYAGAGCIAGAAATIVWEPGGWTNSNADGTLNDIDYVESPTGPFQIIDPAVVTTKTAPADINPPGANGLLRQFQFIPADNGSLDIDYAAISFCGRADATVADADCIECRYTTANTSGKCDIDWSEIAWFSGTMAYSIQNPAEDIELTGLSIRDVLPQNDAPPMDTNLGTSHGIRIIDNNTATIRDVRVDQLSTRRIGDDAFQLVYDSDDAKVGGRTTMDYNDVSYTRSTNVWASLVAPVASCECVDYSTPSAGIGAGVEGRFLIDQLLCSNISDGAIVGPSDQGQDYGGIVFSNSVIRNVAGNCFIPTNLGVTPVPWADFGAGFKIVNNACIVPGAGTNLVGGWHGAGQLYSNLIYSQQGSKFAQSAYGNMWLQRSGAAAGIGFDIEVLGEVGDGFPSTLTFRDNVSFNSGGTIGATAFTGANGSGGSPPTTVDHHTHVGSATGTNLFLQLLNTDFTVTNSVSLTTSSNLIRNDDAAPACPTLTDDYNFYLRTGATDCLDTGCVGGCVLGANTIPTGGAADSGQLSFANMQIPDLTISPTSTAYTSLGSDGTHRGARCAGPANWQILELVYPPLNMLGRPGVHDANCYDKDGDGLYDLHDTCDTDPDPLAVSCE